VRGVELSSFEDLKLPFWGMNSFPAGTIQGYRSKIYTCFRSELTISLLLVINLPVSDIKI